MFNLQSNRPYFGKLGVDDPLHQKLFVSRGFLFDEIREDMEEGPAMGRPFFGMLCGTPGSGKSTFCRFFGSRTLNSIYLDLDEHAVLNESGEIRINIDSFLNFFSNLEKKLLQHVGDVADNQNDIDAAMADLRIKYINLQDDTKGPDFDVIRFDLTARLSLMVEHLIHEVTIIADNVDYLHPVDQYVFIALLSEMTRKNPHRVKVLYSGRPVNTALAKYAFRSLHGEAISNSYELEDLTVAEIVEPRIKFSKMNSKRAKVDDEVVMIVQKLSCGNIDKVLDFYSRVYGSYLKDKKAGQVIDTSTLYELVRRYNMHKFLPDIFDKKIFYTSMPIIYCMLTFLRGETEISDGFYAGFREHLKSIRRPGKDARAIKPIDDAAIDRALLLCKELYLIRRIDFLSEEALTNTVENPSNMRQTTCSLTLRGLTLLELAKTRDYNSIASSTLWPTAISNHIGNLKPGDYAYVPENSQMVPKLVE